MYHNITSTEQERRTEGTPSRLMIQLSYKKLLPSVTFTAYENSDLQPHEIQC